MSFSSNGGGAAYDFRNFLGDAGLAVLVVDERQLVYQGVALSEAAFIATMRADCSEAMFSATAW
jgi:hypothetical protein